jgi:hypothetical protein
VNQIGVTRTRNEGFDEYDRHAPENIKALRAAFAAGWPGAPMTWALSWAATGACWGGSIKSKPVRKTNLAPWRRCRTTTVP